MKTNFLVLLLILAGLSRAMAHGSEGVGGGSSTESAFRLRAQDLINRVEQIGDANSLCEAQIMRDGLENSQIRIVDKLWDTSKKQPILNQHLDAWTSPGDMQLLKSTWDELLLKKGVSDGKSIDALILHEVYRTTSKCNDNAFRISGKVLSLINKMPGKYSRVFTFTQKNVETGAFAPCDIKLAPLKADQVVTCFYSSANSENKELGHLQINSMKTYIYDVRSSNPSGQMGVGSRNSTMMSLAIPVRISTAIKLQNIAQMASESQPFYVVLDLKSGDWHCGFDLADLEKIQSAAN